MDRGGSGGSNVSSDSSDGEDQEESSSFHQPVYQDDLASFREKWQKELRIGPKKNDSKKNVPEKQTERDSEEEARRLFLTGIEMEKSGKLYEAIQFYRRAVQIEPDIEKKLDNFKPVIRDRGSAVEEKQDGYIEEVSPDSAEDSDEEEMVKEGKLLSRIQKKMAKISVICSPKNDQMATHISVLPLEIVFLILRWLVSSDLDLKSLESFGSTCRGFYLCSRDPEVWRLACLRVWGLNCGSSPGSYITWRNMFIERSRIQFNGCYISKTTYIRHGENSFQDQFYRPWYIVAYFRYLRFFPDGKVLVLTSADEPAQGVPQLKNRFAKNPVLTGYYRIKDDKVTLIVQKVNEKAIQAFKKTKKQDSNMYETAEQTFHMEFQIKNHRHKRHAQLVWTHYSIYRRNLIGDESTCNFDLLSNSFPPLWFSRVKSYTLESESPLQ